MNTNELRERLCGIGATDLSDAIDFSNSRLFAIEQAIKKYSEQSRSLGLGYIVSGSLARLEALEASDVDLIALCEEGTELDSVQALDQNIRAWVRSELSCDVSRGENFTGPTLLAGVVGADRIGGSGDHVNVLTKRMIILAESRSVDASGLGPKFQTGVLAAFAGSPATRRRHVIALADEVVRYYRTLTIDYKSRVDHEGKAWSTRYLKLRHSRKYWFFSIVMGLTSLWAKYEAYPDQIDRRLPSLFSLSPTERLVDALENAGLSRQLDVIGFYSRFLREFRDVDLRASLEDVIYESRYDSVAFRNLKRNADRMHRSMLEVIDSVPVAWRRHIQSRFLLSA